MKNMKFENSPLSSNFFLCDQLISGCPNVSRKTSVFVLAQIWDEPLTEGAVFDLLWLLILFFEMMSFHQQTLPVFYYLHTYPGKPKTTSINLINVIISKFTPYDKVALTCVHVVLDMVQSSNWTFPIGLSRHLLNWVSKEFL